MTHHNAISIDKSNMPGSGSSGRLINAKYKQLNKGRIFLLERFPYAGMSLRNAERCIYVQRRAINFNKLVAAAHITTPWAINLPPKRSLSIAFQINTFQNRVVYFYRKKEFSHFFYETG